MAWKWWNRFKLIFNFRKSIPLTYKLLLDQRVPKGNKIILLVVGIGYFLLPVDLIPDFLLPGIGYLDDIAVILFLMDRFINSAPPEVVSAYLKK